MMSGRQAGRNDTGSTSDANPAGRTRCVSVLLALAVVAAFTTALGVAPASADPVPHNPMPVSPRTFDNGNIISDEEFYNTTSMSPEQVRDFINTQGQACTGPACLKDIRLTTQDQPADRYCAEYHGDSSEDAAAVLTKVSVACGVNPQVMLVTLQKESSLLTAITATEDQYDNAFGWHCPDTGPGGTAGCDPAYAGFFNQSYGMAKQWSRYRLDPEKYHYRAGQTVDILWNVEESGCGSAPVTIANTATASLYNYTPYQPNAASLAAYPGPGDACSTYGNRNFASLYQRYFRSRNGMAPGVTGTAQVTPLTVPTVPTTVTIPHNPYVSAEVAGHTITAPNPAVAKGLTAGLTALGLPYVWGGGGSGVGPNNGCARGGGDYNSCGAAVGFDCSGLTAFVLQQAGYRIPDNSGTQRAGGVTIDWEQALPGDIVGFPGHVAIYLGVIGGAPYILEASTVGVPVHVVKLTRSDHDPSMYRHWS